MKKQVPPELRCILDRVREEATDLSRPQDLFDTVLEIVEYVASREDLIGAKRWQLEPDHLAGRLLSDPQSRALSAVESILSGADPADLERIGQILLKLERSHGRAHKTPPNHRILFDGAILGQLGFVYSRKYSEVLATQSALSATGGSNLLEQLLAKVDKIFDKGRPAYLWRLGPEFGTDPNIAHLLDRGDWFIVRSLYRSRAKRMAGSVLRWEELPNGRWVGEHCDEQHYAQTARNLVLKWRERGKLQHAVLVTNLLNMSWDDIYRFYSNRSCKHLVAIDDSAYSHPMRSRIAASFLILAIFTFRNVRTWAKTANAFEQSSVGTTAGQEEEQTEPIAELVESPRRPLLFEWADQTIDYFQNLSTDGKRLEGIGVTATPQSMYQVHLEPGSEVETLREGQIIFVDPTAGTVFVYHGDGFVTRFHGLGSLADGIQVGATVEAGQVLGTLSGEEDAWFGFEPTIAARFLESGVEPSVAELLNDDANLFFDPLNLLSQYDGETPLPDGSEPMAAPSLADADAFLLKSPFTEGNSVFISSAAIGVPAEIDVLVEVFDDDIFDQVLGEEIS